MVVISGNEKIMNRMSVIIDDGGRNAQFWVVVEDGK